MSSLDLLADAANSSPTRKNSEQDSSQQMQEEAQEEIKEPVKEVQGLHKQPPSTEHSIQEPAKSADFTVATTAISKKKADSSKSLSTQKQELASRGGAFIGPGIQTLLQQNFAGLDILPVLQQLGLQDLGLHELGLRAGQESKTSASGSETAAVETLYGPLSRSSPASPAPPPEDVKQRATSPTDLYPSLKRDAPGDPKYSVYPCRARGMPSDHNAKSAYFQIASDIQHKEDLMCSHQGCRDGGIKFCYCSRCGVAVAKRNFRKRHDHGIVDLEYDRSGNGRAVIGGSEAAASSQVQPALMCLPVAAAAAHNAPKGIAAAAASGGKRSSSSTEGGKKRKSSKREKGRRDHKRSKKQRNIAERLLSIDDKRISHWRDLLKERPQTEEDLAMSGWLLRVMLVSDLKRPVPRSPKRNAPSGSQRPMAIFGIADSLTSSTLSDEVLSDKKPTAKKRKQDSTRPKFDHTPLDRSNKSSDEVKGRHKSSKKRDLVEYTDLWKYSSTSGKKKKDKSSSHKKVFKALGLVRKHSKHAKKRRKMSHKPDEAAQIDHDSEKAVVKTKERRSSHSRKRKHRHTSKKGTQSKESLELN